MKFIYLLSQGVNNDYDTHDSMVVAEESPESAKQWHPYGKKDAVERSKEKYGTWAHPDNVSVVLIGTAAIGVEAGVVLASFNAG